MRRARLVALALGVAVAAISPPAAQMAVDDAPASGEPIPTTLIEQSGTRLVQVDVSVSGPADVVATLGPDDFDVRTNMTRVREFTVDRFCTGEGDEPRASDRHTPALAAHPALPATYMLYFDQPHLTLSGRQRAIDVAQELLPRLLVGGSRAMIVSNAASQAVLAPLTDDLEVLDDALEQLQRDRTQWDMWSTDEDRRVGEVVEVLNDDGDTGRAISRARSYQRQERWTTDKHVRRLTVNLARLGDSPAPKAVLYFGDTLRRNPGEHYLTFFGSHVIEANPQLMRAQSDSFTAGLPFDRLLDEATAQGIRFYTIEAAGLSAPIAALQPAARVMERTYTIPDSSRVRFRDAKATLGGLARETGGRAFLDGIKPDRIARSILDDLSCMYLISFDPGALREDRPVRLAVRSTRDDVRLRTRGRVVVKSESARTTTRLLSALAAGDRSEDGLELRSALVPTSFADGRYRALLQVRVPRTSLVATTWDLGASLLHDEHVRDELSGRFDSIPPGTSLVLEAEVELPPGEHEIYALAHETSGGLVLSDHHRVDWPDPKGEATIVSVAIVQGTDALIQRDGTPRRDGTVARDGGEPIVVGRPTAVLGLVCRGKRKRAVIEARRRLVGATAVEFPALELDLRDERCAQIRDLVPPDLLAPGSYRYEIELVRDGETSEQRTREFRTASLEAS